MLRRGAVGDTFGGGESDALPQRGALGKRAHAAVQAELVTLLTGFRTERIELTGDRAVLIAEDGRSLPAADHVVALTGFRPELSFLSEMRLELDPVLQAPSQAGAGDRPECALVRQCATARRSRTGSPRRAWAIPGGDEVLRPRTHVPGVDRL